MKELQRWARARHGLVTFDDWIASGRSRRTFYRHHGDMLVRVGPGVARFASVPITAEQTILGAVLACPGSMASHRSATFLWGPPVTGDDPVDLIMFGRSAPRRLSNVVIHRPRDVDGLRPVPRRGIPTTNPMRTILDLGAVRPDLVEPALRALLISGIVSPPGIVRTLQNHRRPGRAGTGALDAALEALAIDGKIADSLLESAMSALLTKAALTNWQFHPVVSGYELDFGFPDERLNVEVDGWKYYRDQFERDRERDADLAAVGWMVLRFSWSAVKNRPSWVADRIGAALARRREVWVA